MTIGIIAALEADGLGPVRILCHDIRDLAFASSLGDVEYFLPDDVFIHLEPIRRAALLVSLRLHSVLPALSFGKPAVSISYDERSLSLMRTIGMGEWGIGFVRSTNVVAKVRDRCSRLEELKTLRHAAQPVWRALETVMRDKISTFAGVVAEYAFE